MAQNNLFSAFDYIVGNDFPNKDKREVKVFFYYKGAYVIILSLFIKKASNRTDEAYYLNEAKKVIKQMIADGSLEKYCEKYIKKEKRKKTLAILLLILGVCAIAGAIVGAYFAFRTTDSTDEYFYIKNIGDTEASLTYGFEGDDAINFPDIHYSYDKVKWETLTIGTKMDDKYFARTSIAPNKTIYYYGDNPNGLNNMGKGYVNIVGKVDDSGEVVEEQDGKLAAGGNVLSLIYGKEFKGRTDLPGFSYGCFVMLFSQNYNLVTAKDLFLPYAGPKVASFAYMFYACKNLEYAPILWASDSDLTSQTENGCYTCMFVFCPFLKELRVNFSKWPTYDALAILANAGMYADSPTFYWRGPDDPDRTIIPPDDVTVPENWKVVHWQ